MEHLDYLVAQEFLVLLEFGLEFARYKNRL